MLTVWRPPRRSFTASSTAVRRRYEGPIGTTRFPYPPLDVRWFVVDTFLFGEEDPELTDDASLLELAIVDSTGTLELVAFLESELTIRVSDGEMTAENLDSIRRISDYSPL